MNEVIIRLKNQNKLHSALKSQKHCKIKAGIFFSVRPSPELCSKAFQLLKAQRLINEGSCSEGPGEQLGGGKAVFDEVEFSLSHNH